MDYLPLWFLYSIVVMNIFLVEFLAQKLHSEHTLQVLNASSNFLIYLFAGHSFRGQLRAALGCGPPRASFSPHPARPPGARSPLCFHEV
jgi:hypothetical protein